MTISSIVTIADDKDGGYLCLKADVHGQELLISLDPANRHYQEVLDAIIEQGADCFEGDIPADLQAAADAKEFAQQEI